MKGVKVKICGITNPEDARWAANFGADFVGINFCRQSPRHVSLDMAGQIAGSLPGFVKAVGVLADASEEEIARVLKKVNLAALQLHGSETPEFARSLKERTGLEVWKAVRVESEASLRDIPAYSGAVDAVLLDAHVPGLLGGSGTAFDWGLAARAKDSGIPVILAGGLTPENVEEAVKKAAPAIVDTAGGVEKDGHPRKKDPDKMKSFILKAKGA